MVLVEVDEHFRVAVRAEAMAAAEESVPQRAVVVDFAVEDDPDRAVFVGQRLMSAGDVEDGEAAMSQGDAGLGIARCDEMCPRRPGRGGAARRSSAGASLAPRLSQDRSKPRR